MLASHSHTTRLRQDEAELSDMFGLACVCVASRLLPDTRLELITHGVGMLTNVVGYSLA